MFENHPGTRLHLVSTTTFHDDGFARHVVTTRRRSASSVGVYVAHPITGIRVSRIHAMQDRVSSLMRADGERAGLDLVPLFPMRTNHLMAHETGANVYDPAAGDFARVRHYTLQNRMDAVVHSDGVLVNYDLAADDGSYKVSNGIPFDVGWAAATGRPTVVVQPEGNPNPTCRLSDKQVRVHDLEEGIGRLVGLLSAERRDEDVRVVAEILTFPTKHGVDALAALAQADVRRHRDGCRAILVVMDEASEASHRHGQVDEVADWVVRDEAAAWRIVDRLLAAG